MKIHLTKTAVDQLANTGQRYSAWDTVITGFGVRVSAKGAKTYVLKYTNNSKVQKTYTIGNHGDITPKLARDEAQKLKGINAAGRDPHSEKMAHRRSLTVSELCDKYLAEGCSHKKQSTIYTDKGRIRRHIKPLLGSKKVADITKNDITRFYDDIKKGKTATREKTKKQGLAVVTGGDGTARKAVKLLSAMYNFAIDDGLDTINPTQGVKLGKDNKNKRFLSESELGQLQTALNNAKLSGTNVFAVSAIELLTLTGCRKGEILNLRWSEVDLAEPCLNLADSKTGKKIIPISDKASEVIEKLPKINNSKFVFPGSNPSKSYSGIQKVWKNILESAGLENVRIHDLRHTFASTAASNGVPLAIIGSLLGHKDPSTTQQYAHITNEASKTATNQIANILSEAMQSKSD